MNREDIDKLNELEEREQEMQQSGQGQFESENFKFGELLIKDDMTNWTKGVAEKFPIIFDKEMALSNLTEKDIKWFMIQLDIAKIDYMMSRPEMDLDYAEVQNFDMLKMKARAKLMRSTGGMMRERGLFAQQHQIRQFITDNQGNKASGGIIGFMQRAMGGGGRR